VPCLTHRAAVNLWCWRYGCVPIDHSQVKCNAALSAVDPESGRHGWDSVAYKSSPRVLVAALPHKRRCRSCGSVTHHGDTIRPADEEESRLGREQIESAMRQDKSSRPAIGSQGRDRVSTTEIGRCVDLGEADNPDYRPGRQIVGFRTSQAPDRHGRGWETWRGWTSCRSTSWPGSSGRSSVSTTTRSARAVLGRADRPHARHSTARKG
jgi:hypothetical protein